MRRTILLGIVLGITYSPVFFSQTSMAQGLDHAHHDHGSTDADAVPAERPKVFLDKSPKIVKYQLDRLDNARLLLVERDLSDAKYAPVYEAILTRDGMTGEHRQAALDALVVLRKSNPVEQLLGAVGGLDLKNRASARVIEGLGQMLTQLPIDTLAHQASALESGVSEAAPAIRPYVMAALIASGQLDSLIENNLTDQQLALRLAGVALVPSADTRNQYRDQVVTLISGNQSVEIQRAAIRATSTLDNILVDTQQHLIGLLRTAPLRSDVVSTLLKLPKAEIGETLSRSAVETLVNLAETTPAAERTTPEFLDAMQLADQYMAVLPASIARPYRTRLRDVTVRVVQIRTIKEEMRYDLPYFAVEAGRPVQIVLKNEDLMPHNLVITTPGSLQEVAELGSEIGPDKGMDGKGYVPHTDKVLWATTMVDAHKQESLTFTAPSEVGEYPYVCTFPRHWMRMHGVMVVVEDLDEWLENPVEPKSPIGNNRSFVKSWTVEDFATDLDQGLRGRTPEIGHKMFVEATCQQCHLVAGQGGKVGPALDGVLERWKGDHTAVLREILDPSHRIDPKYAMHLVLTLDGRTHTGILLEETKESISLLANPESAEPLKISQNDIEELVKTSTSMMPKGLLDQYTKDEILELLAYVLSLKN